jgi:DNA-binding Xre family transcriptional regulator
MTHEQIDTLRAVPLGLMPNRLAIALAFQRVSQTDVCEVTGLSNSRMSAIVNGKRPAVTVDEAARISRFFECQIEDIFPVPQDQRASDAA